MNSHSLKSTEQWRRVELEQINPMVLTCTFMGCAPQRSEGTNQIPPPPLCPPVWIKLPTGSRVWSILVDFLFTSLIVAHTLKSLQCTQMGVYVFPTYTLLSGQISKTEFLWLSSLVFKMQNIYPREGYTSKAYLAKNHLNSPRVQGASWNPDIKGR